MQLVAYGAQDVYLTGNPQITFWKVTYRRHTNFAMESIEQTFNGQADFGRHVSCTISRNGDLAYKTYLQVTLPQISQNLAGDGASLAARWLDYPGEQLISEVRVEIGGQKIDKQYGDWMHIWNQLTLTSEQERGYNQMVGQTLALTYVTQPRAQDVDQPCNSEVTGAQCVPRKALPETTLYVPLQFWFCRNPGLAIPLIALQYHEVKIEMDLNFIDQCLWAIEYDPRDITLDRANDNILPGTGLSGLGTNGNGSKAREAYKKSLVAASLYVDYVFLDTDERRRMAQNPHEYLIEQLQFTGEETIGSSSNKIRLSFNHPCKELVWVVQPTQNVDYCASLANDTATTNSVLRRALGAQPFNYTDAVDALPNTWLAYEAEDVTIRGNGEDLFDFPVAAAVEAAAGENAGGRPGLNQGVGAVVGTEVLANGGAGVDMFELDANAAPRPTNPNSGVSDAGSYVLAKLALNKHCWGQNPVVTAKLQLNGQDRFSEREGTYFDLVQPYQHHTRNPDTGINVYSFALRPEEHQPSGTCNFSRIDNASLQLVVSSRAVADEKTANVRVYATNYNVLRVMSGMGGLAYSN